MGRRGEVSHLSIGVPGSAPASTSRLVARNSLWYGIEVAAGVLTAFFTSIAVARAIGPERLGYYSYINWLTNIAGAMGTLGIPVTTRKYMAEYLGGGRGGLARAVFSHTIRLQAWLSAALTAAGIALVLIAVPEQHRLVSGLLVLAMPLRMMILIPSHANAAAENMAGNVPGALAGNLAYALMVGLSLVLGWGLVGVAAGTLLSMGVELALKLAYVRGWVRKLPVEQFPAELSRRLLVFSGQGTVLLALNILVWGRSDIILLKALNSDIRQVTFFSLAVSLTDKLLLIPQVFSQAMGASLMAQYGRDRSKLPQMSGVAFRYVFLCALPLLVGLAAVSGPAVRVLYGTEYLPMIPVLAVAGPLAVPKALRLLARQLMQAAERQGFLIAWVALCGVFNVLLDLLLIPRYGALGAAIANGTAQTLATAGIWVRARRLFKLEFGYRVLLKALAAAGGMSLAASVSGSWLGGVAGLVAGIVSGGIVFLALIRGTGTLGAEDRKRLLVVGRELPGVFRYAYQKLVQCLTIPGQTPALSG